MRSSGRGWWLYISRDEDQLAIKQINRELIQRIWYYARPYRFKVLGLLCTILVITGLSLIPPLLYRELIDNALPNGDVSLLNMLALGMILIPIINALVGAGQRYLSATIGESLIADLRNELFAHLQKMSLRFFTHTKTGELMSRLNSDVVGAQTAVTNTFINIITNIITVIATLAIMFTLEWRLTLMSIILVPLFVVPARRVGRVMRDVRRESMDLNAKMNGALNEGLNVDGALLAKLFGRQADEEAKLGTHVRAVANIGVRYAMIGRWFFLMLGLVSAIGVALVFWMGGHYVLQGAFTIGTLVAFGRYLIDLYGPLSAMSNAHIEFSTSVVSFERVFEILDLQLEIEDVPNPIQLQNVSGGVKFDDVYFSYTEGGDGGASLLGLTANGKGKSKANGKGKSKDNGKGKSKDNGKGKSKEIDKEESSAARVSSRRMAIEGISFDIKHGQLVALVGPSGAGKTTITYLLPRLYDPTAGRICIDGYDLREVSQLSLALAIGMVTQQTYLFHDTIKANLMYARPDATSEQLESACRAANIHNMIESLPKGYDTIVGERGYRLSGGEKQRLAIARVILKDPQILVLDEATSSLDSKSEALIQDALEGIMQNRTSIVIAHRLSTILAADVILVMSDGRLVEQGHRTETQSAHEILLAQDGLYANLYQTQFRMLPQGGE
ncbi:ABC transporter ATP-binding protein [Anaerolineales bacterium HSG24]|nr:ABC transporter ATP-binding protein [Anaerolineales bacterium HSG24]